MTIGIDRAIFDKLRERMKAKFPILLEGYLRDARIYLATIETNITGGELKEVIEASHSLKSSSGLLGVMDVHNEAKNIEYTAKELLEQEADDYQSLSPICRDLLSAFSAVEGELINELQKTSQQ